MPAYGEYRVDVAAGLIYGKRGRPVGCPDTSGYLQVDTYVNGRRVMRNVARWVWETANGPIPDGLEPNHINGIKTDNRIANLELVTRRDNILHAYRTGLKSNQGEKHPSHKLTENDVLEIRRALLGGAQRLELAARFGVCRQTIRDIDSRKTWKHVIEEDPCLS